jgi:uracil-DNA glycosylase
MSRPISDAPIFDSACVQCPRLAAFLGEVRTTHPGYYARPVPVFGDPQARLLIVGLAPGMHGANRTGRPFTGDYAGILLYETLYKFGYADRVGTAEPDDGLVLRDCRISNAVKCLPPVNKPLPDEIKRCNQYLAAEFAQQPAQVILALGRIAHDAVLMGLGLKLSAHRFGHHARHPLPQGMLLIDSYHCSRYNTQTKRLTTAMFEAIFQDIAAELGRQSMVR